jgi:hypothetical protein
VFTTSFTWVLKRNNEKQILHKSPKCLSRHTDLSDLLNSSRIKEAQIGEIYKLFRLITLPVFTSVVKSMKGLEMSEEIL